MDNVPAAHPSDRALSAFGLGKLDVRSAEAVDRHLEECPCCRERVAVMSADSFLARVRDAQSVVKASSGQTQPKDTEELHGVSRRGATRVRNTTARPG